MYSYGYSEDHVPVISQNISISLLVCRFIVKISPYHPESMYAREFRHLSQRQEF